MIDIVYIRYCCDILDMASFQLGNTQRACECCGKMNFIKVKKCNGCGR